MADPAIGLRFDVTVDGVALGSFTACEGLGAEYEITSYEEGGLNGYVHQLPGRLKYQNVKLSRAVDQDSGRLASWFSSLQRSVKRRTASIVACDGKGAAIVRWNLVDVYPARWTGPSFSSDGNSIAKETLELVHNGFTVGAS